MGDLFTYDFGYSWPWTYGHLVAALVFALLGVLSVVLGWRVWIRAVLAVGVLWGLTAWVVFDRIMLVPSELPTARFLESGSGRVLDGGAGSGRTTVTVLRARPAAHVVALDLFKEGYGIDRNSPDRLRANARLAGGENRVEVKDGDLRALPFDADTFDAAISSFAIDHLGKQGAEQSIREMARVLKPGGQFLLMVLDSDIYVKFAYPLVNMHMYWGHGGTADRWRQPLRDAGFEIVEEGKQPATMFFLVRKPARM